MTLHAEKCEPCRLGGAPLPDEEVQPLAATLPGWSVTANKLERELVFKDFRTAMTFVNRVADLANQEDHHPDLFISYNRVRLTLFTHKTGGLSRNDFILAAKIDRLMEHPGQDE